MARNRLLPAVALGLALAACNPTYVDYDYDRNVDFSRFKTFEWMEQKATPEGKPKTYAQSGLLKARIERAVDDGLEAKGLRRVDTNPDLFVSYLMGVKNYTEIRRSGYGYGFGGNVRADQFQEGTLILDLIDAATNELVWRGIAEGVITENPSPEKLTKEVNDTVKKLLSKYPPPKG
jgi:hypothetical protein